MAAALTFVVVTTAGAARDTATQEPPAPVETAPQPETLVCPAEPVEREPRPVEQPSEALEEAARDVNEVTGLNFVPIPEFIADPNEGNTYGAMGVWLFTDVNRHIRYMLAPDIRYNATKGVYPNFRLFGYPDPWRRYKISLGKSSTKDQNYELRYVDRGLLDLQGFVIADVGYDEDSTERFYGFGNTSQQHEESNYTGENFSADLSPGYWLWPAVNASYRMRIRHMAITRGQVTSLPYIAVEHPDVRTRGLAPAVYWQHELALTYDTRDSMDIPTDGAYANLYVDGADQHVGSATSFCAFGLEAKDYIPFRAERRNPILALRVLVDWMQGGTHTPFWLMNDLGGRRRLRGYGGDRFIDFNRSLATVELRTRVYERTLFGVDAQLEVAPFVETGQVFHDLGNSPVGHLHWVGGVGFRGIVPPQVVAFVDVGYGGEGSAIFTGIDYPF